MYYRVYFYNYLRTSRRDILPRFGQVVDIMYVDTPFEQEQKGSQVYGAATLYLPGILKHQTLKVTASAQKQDPARYLMNNLLSLPRGVEYQIAEKIRKISFDYVFPIWYPDMRIWHAAYFKRFQGRLFFDHAYAENVYDSHGQEPPQNKNFQSMGTELTTDVHLAQIMFPMNIGARFIYLPANNTTRTEFIFSVDLNQFR